MGFGRMAVRLAKNAGSARASAKPAMPVTVTGFKRGMAVRKGKSNVGGVFRKMR